MNKQNKSSKVIYGLVLVLTLLISVSIISLSNTAYAVSLKDDLGLSAEYALGTEIDIPKGTLIVNEKEYPAEAVVYLPDGNAVKTERITLDMIGLYSIRYTAQVGGKYYGKSVEFHVKKNAMSVDGSGSSFRYDKETDRIHLDLAGYEVFTFNQVIDLKGRTADDALLSIYVDATSDNARDFEEYIIVLTDAYDPTNKVYVRVQADWAPDYHPNVWNDPNDIYYYGLYQSYTAVNFDGGKEWVFNSNGEIRTTEQHGKAIYTSFCNRGSHNPWINPKPSVEDDVFILSYDYETNSIHTLGSRPVTEPTIIADLDDAKYFQNNWKGFTNGMVYISIYAQDVHTSAKMVIKDIDTDKSKEGLISDITAPVVNVDCGEYSNSKIPTAIVGKPYKLFDTSVMDENLSDPTVSCKVYYNYKTEQKTQVALNGNSFIPEYAGAYTVVYQAMDDFGNIGEAIIEVNATNKAAPLTIEAVGSNSIAGVPSLISSPKVVSYDSKTGNLYLTIRAKKNNINDLIYEGYLSDYSPTEYIFMMSGEWTLEYTVKDYSRVSMTEVKVDVTSENSVIYETFEDLAIDRFFISGSTYILPSVQIVTFDDNKANYKNASIKLIYNGKEQVLDSNLVEIDAAVMGSSVEIVYYDNNNDAVKISGTREIYDIGQINKYQLDKLFISDKANITATNTAVQIDANRNAEISFINKLSAIDLSFRFNLNSAGKNFGMFNIVLTDSQDPNVQVRINIANRFNSISSTAGNASVYINGNSKESIMSAASFTGLNNRYFEISYSNTSRAVKIENQSLIVNNCINGDVFEGFPSGSVYVSFEMSGVTGSSTVEFYNINGQGMSDYGEDFGKPVVNVNGSYSSTYGINSTLSTYTALGLDVISGYCNPTVSIRLVGGDYVKDLNGQVIRNLDATQSYDLRLDSYGEYIVTYTAYDASNNLSVSNYFSFYVEDIEKPTLEINGLVIKVGFVGDKFIMPDVKATDDNTENLEVFAVVINPDSSYSYVTNDGYVYTQKGTHTVILGVFDSEGNLTTVKYYVEVI